MITISEISQKKVVIFGTGFHAAKCMYLFQQTGIKVNYFLNNNAETDCFCGIPVQSPTEQNVKGVYVVVASLEHTYIEIAKQLQSMGLEEFSEYIYYGWLDKEIVLLHGNCHMIIIKDYLLSSKAFCEKYVIYPNPLICENKAGKIEKKVLVNCDIWIHEDIRSDNGYGYYLSDEGIRENINKNVVEIIIPHLFGLGKVIFPQAENGNDNNGAIANGKDKNGIFPFGDNVIDSCYRQGKSRDEIIAFCKSDYAISAERIKEIFQVYMDKIREREKNWDIKIYDFLLENMKKVKLFYDPGHPANIVLKKVSEGILLKLGIENEDIYAEKSLDAHEIPVYPIVKKTLQLEWKEDFVRSGKSSKTLNNKMDFDEYIREYIWWCYESKTENT